MVTEKHKAVRERPEAILCSAVYVDDGVKRARTYVYPETGILFGGCRHVDCLVAFEDWKSKLTQEEINKIDDIDERQLCGTRQGFVTTRGRYVGREEAGDIARAAGQWDQLTRQLYSEDVW